MIVLFLGVSSVGKTSIMEVLAETHGWRWLPVHMSRDVREGEHAKIKMSRDEIDKRREEDCYLWVNEIHEDIYATPLRPILRAEHADEFFMLDFPIESREEAFKNVTHQSIIVMPESTSQLIDQAKESSRSDRIPELLRSFKKHYSHFSDFDGSIKCLSKRSWLVVNHINRIGDTARLIATRMGDLRTGKRS